MALIEQIELQPLEKNATHRVVRCSYSLVPEEGGLFLQLDTYGSAQRKIKNKKSQSLRFTEKALRQLVRILKDNRLGGL